MFQQLVQVAGRAGRAASSGEVLIQTGFPGHPYIQMIKAHDYQGFATAALLERDQAGYPPSTHIALFRAESTRSSDAIQFLTKVEKIGKKICTLGGFDPAEILSAVPSPMEKLAGRYRAQLMVRSATRAPLHRLMSTWLIELEKLKQSRRVRWSVDIDPMDMF
jgi:primosomal protein N' (replication factor Y)